MFKFPGKADSLRFCAGGSAVLVAAMSGSKDGNFCDYRGHAGEIEYSIAPRFQSLM